MTKSYCCRFFNLSGPFQQLDAGLVIAPTCSRSTWFLGAGGHELLLLIGFWYDRDGAANAPRRPLWSTGW